MYYLYCLTQHYLAVILISFSMLISNCQVLGSKQKDVQLIGTKWTLVNSFFSEGGVEFARAGDFTFTLSPSNVAEGNALCNECGGAYELIGSDSLSISLGCTKKGCPTWPRYRNSGFPYGDVAYEIEGSELRISDGRARFVYRSY